MFNQFYIDFAKTTHTALKQYCRMENVLPESLVNTHKTRKSIKLHLKVNTVKKVVSFLILFVATISLIGCSNRISETAYDNLIESLEKMDFTVTAEDVGKDILLGQRKRLTLDGQNNLSVFLYENNEKMEKDASRINKDGASYGDDTSGTQINWSSLPHFFKKDTIIVLYVGEDPEIMNALNDIMGPQFAGKALIS